MLGTAITVGSVLVFLAIAFGVAVIVKKGFRVVQQSESGLLFSLGRFKRVMNPGPHVIIPFFQDMKVMDMRQVVHEMPPQEVMTKDNVSVKVGAAVFYQVKDPERVFVGLADYHEQARSKTQAVLMEVIGASTLDQVLTDRAGTSERAKDLVMEELDQWGLLIDRILLQQVELPDSLEKAMAQVAVAERNKEATLIAAEAERQAARSLLPVAYAYGQVPASIELRTLQVLQSVSTSGDASQRTVVFVPNGAIGLGQKLASEGRMPASVLAELGTLLEDDTLAALNAALGGQGGDLSSPPQGVVD